jgi:fucose permease
MDAATAARWVSFYYGSLTLGRFLTGFITYKVSNKDLIRHGCFLMLAGILLLPLSMPFALLGFLLIGFGCAPIFPCMLHETPVRFGGADSQAIMGFQMAVAYIGTTFLPPFFGFLASESAISRLPAFLLAYMAVLIAGSEILRRFKPQG